MKNEITLNSEIKFSSQKLVTLANGAVVDASLIDKVFVKHFGKTVNLTVEVMTLAYGEKEIKFLDFVEMSRDAHIVALPALGVKGQERVLIVSKGDSAKAQFRADNLSAGKIKAAVNEACRGLSWNDFCEVVAGMLKYTYTKGADGKRERSGVALRYKTVHSTDAELSFMAKYVFKRVEVYLKGLAYSEKRSKSPEERAKAKAERALAKARKMIADAEEQAKSVGLTA